MTEDTTTSDDEIGSQIESLARDLVRTINTAPAGQREQLRDMAVHLLRDEVEFVVPSSAVDTAPSGASNPFAIGIPLLLVGFVMLILFPPVGLLLCAAAALMMLWGIASVVLARREP